MTRSPSGRTVNSARVAAQGGELRRTGSALFPGLDQGWHHHEFRDHRHRCHHRADRALRAGLHRARSSTRVGAAQRARPRPVRASDPGVMSIADADCRCRVCLCIAQRRTRAGSPRPIEVTRARAILVRIRLRAAARLRSQDGGMGRAGSCAGSTVIAGSSRRAVPGDLGEMKARHDAASPSPDTLAQRALWTAARLRHDLRLTTGQPADDIRSSATRSEGDG